MIDKDAIAPSMIMPLEQPPAPSAPPDTPSVPSKVPLDQKPVGFVETYGWLGIPMVLAFLASSAVVFFQAYLQLHPTEVANTLMNTTNYDGGEFWLLTEHPPSITAAAATVLILIGIGYIGLVVFMIGFRSTVASRKKVVQPARSGPSKAGASLSKAAIQHRLRQIPLPMDRHPWLAQLMQRVTQTYAILSQYKNAVVDLPKLAFQTVTLINYLRDGFAAPLIIFYASLLGVNWVISFFRFRQHEVDKRMVITRLCCLFDLFFAVFAPMVVLAYSCSVFSFDRETFRTHEEGAYVGAFERLARIFADPLEVARFRAGFNNLRLATPASIIIKGLLNILSLIKWKMICTMLIQDHQHYAKAKRPSQVQAIPTKAQDAAAHRERRRQLILGVVVFLLFGGFVMVYTIVAYVTTTANCAAYRHQCPVVSYGWSVGNSDCPCLVFIDRHIELKTYAEWIHPPNITDDLAAVSRAGKLTIIQIINRQVYPLPEELRNCKQLEQMILMYTKTDRLPKWMNEFTHMHYFHFEGDFSMAGLSYAPDDMFSTMKDLRFIHTGGIQGLKRYPSLKGLKKLTYLTMAVLHSLEELPEMDDLENLEDLQIIEAYHITKLPRLQHLKSLKAFTLAYRSEICCNGFFTGTCDLTNYSCLDRPNEKKPVCTNDRLPIEDQRLLNQTIAGICPPVNFDVNWFKPTPDTTDRLCNGTMYKQGEINGMTGICINGRYQVINCDASGNYDPIRKLQIERGVGTKCDPEVEAWLGCSKE